MQADMPSYIAGAFAVVTLLLLLVLIRSLQRRNRAVPFTPDLLQGRAYRCPACGRDMQVGWVMLGRGAIWSSLYTGAPGTFAHIGLALPNTLSLRLRPASNLGWHCADCQMLIVDHSKLVVPPKGV